MTKLLQFRRPDAAADPVSGWQRRPPRKPPVESGELFARAATVMDETSSLVAAARSRRERRASAPRPHMLDFVAHDLVNDLGAAQMCLTALRKSAPALRLGDSADYLRVLEQSLTHMDQLVADLRDARQMQLDRFVLSATKELQPAALVMAAVDAARRYADGRNLMVACAPRLVSVRADEPRIQRVFANLIGNAIKFTDTQGMITVGARPGAASEEVIFFVRDDGQGMTDAEQRRIFDPIWRRHESSRSGTGLGLMICRGIVEAHGGRISVSSRSKVGSTFAFALPSAAHQQTDRAAE